MVPRDNCSYFRLFEDFRKMHYSGLIYTSTRTAHSVVDIHYSSSSNSSSHCAHGGLVGGPRDYQDQFREFKSHRVHARMEFYLHIYK